MLKWFDYSQWLKHVNFINNFYEFKQLDSKIFLVPEILKQKVI